MKSFKGVPNNEKKIVSYRSYITMKGIIQYSHYLLEDTVLKGETVIDATCGNGNDTLFLSRLVGEQGQVLAFDIQKHAIKTTKMLLEKNKRNNVEYILDSHANVGNYLENKKIKNIGGAIFNLGYLPKSDKTIITKGETTIQAVNSLLSYIKRKGIIVLVIYHGHEGGKQEKELILKHVITLDQKDYNVLQYRFINQQNNPPFIIAIQKK